MKNRQKERSHLTTRELEAQGDHFLEEIELLKKGKALPRSSCLLHLHPLLDSHSPFCVGSREQTTKIASSSQHPVIVHGKHPVAKLLITSEHLRLLHAGPQLLTSMLSQRFHIIGHRKAIRSIVRGCIINFVERTQQSPSHKS